MGEALAQASRWLVPILIASIPLYGLVRRVPVYDAFVEGAAEGLKVSVRILPYLVAIMVALAALRTSGLLEALQALLGPFLGGWGIPADMLPLVLIRPLSGSGALAVTTDLLRRYGPDSPAGLLASVLQGSTDTTFYVLSLYLGSVGVRNPRYALGVCLFGDAVAFVAGVVLWNLLLR